MVTCPGLVASGTAMSAARRWQRPAKQEHKRQHHMQGGLRHCISAYGSGAALLRAWPFSFIFCLIGNGPFGLWWRQIAARATQRPTVESSYIQLQHHRRAAPLDVCGCRRQPSKPGVFDTGGDTSVYIVYQEPYSRTLLWPIPPASFPSIIAFRQWAARARERNLLSAVIFQVRTKTCAPFTRSALVHLNQVSRTPHSTYLPPYNILALCRLECASAITKPRH